MTLQFNYKIEYINTQIVIRKKRIRKYPRKNRKNHGCVCMCALQNYLLIFFISQVLNFYYLTSIILLRYFKTCMHSNQSIT